MRMMLRGIDINVSGVALDIFCQYRQREPRALEAGGVLLGQVSESEKVVLVKRVSVPGPYDKATRTTFERDKVWAQGLIEYEFVNSGGRTVYLGEWHTHPAKRARPSPRDRAMIAEQFCENELRTPFLPGMFHVPRCASRTMLY